MKYQRLTELKQAMEDRQIIRETLSTFYCKGELVINDQQGETVFEAYYGTYNAAEDICALLDLDEPERQ